MNTTKKLLKVTFLGTGTSQGIPMIASKDPVCLSNDFKDKRLRSSVLISWDNFNFVIDCGPDFRQQMLRENVESLNGVFFTHEHSDHTAGIDDLRPFCYQIGEMPIFTSYRTLKDLKQRFDYVFTTENRYPGAPSVMPFLIENAPFYVKDLEVVPIEVLHGNLPVIGYRFQDFAYLTDVKTIENSEKEKLKNLDVLVLNALRIDSHPTHFSLQEALDFVAEIQPKKAYFTHISHKLGFHEEISKQLPENVFLAFDGLKIDV